MLTSLLPPTSGTARVAGLDVTADPAGVRQRIGYIGQKHGAGHNYRVWDELLMQGRFYGLEDRGDRPRGGSCWPPWTSTGWRCARSARCPAARSAGWTSRWA